MTQLETVPNTAKATSSTVSLLSRLVVVFFAAMVSLALPAIVLAQHAADISSQPPGARVAKTEMNKKEKTMNQPSTATEQATAADAIRPFKVTIPEAALVDLRRRIAATKWPEQELVSDASQGVQFALMKKLADYWANYDWRKTEAKLNSYPQFITNIDGLDIHFIHVRSKNPNALPVIITHGWPGSVIEQLKIIGPLTDPVKYGGKAEDSFDVVIPSLPGYGFSGKPTATGWDPQRVARAWAVLMDRLGYKRYVAQGGDWGNAVTEQM